MSSAYIHGVVFTKISGISFTKTIGDQVLIPVECHISFLRKNFDLEQNTLIFNPLNMIETISVHCHECQTGFQVSLKVSHGSLNQMFDI